MKNAHSVLVATLLFSSLSACEGDTGDGPRADAGMADAATQGSQDSGAGDGGATHDAAAPNTTALPPSAATGGDCAEPTGAGTTHASDITGNETWTADDSPHRITTTITVKGTLTIDACARVILAEGVSLHVGTTSDAGRLITRGVYQAASAGEPEVLRPVTFGSDGDTKHWGMLFVSGLGEADFDATVLIRGGDANTVTTSVGGALVSRGPNDGTLRRMVKAHQLLVLDSGSFGVALEAGAGFYEDADAALHVLGTGMLPRPAGYGPSFDPIYPVFVEPPGVGTLPAGSYSGSSDASTVASDKILVVPRAAITVDEQFHDRGLPYLIAGPFYMRPETTATLGIDPGVELRFRREAGGDARYGMTLGDGASVDPRPVTLAIEGTAERPIVFTSDADAPAPGDWMGLYLDCSPSTGNKLVHAEIAYAGGDSGTSGMGCGPTDNDAAILVTDWHPADAFIQNVVVRDSAGGGIVCGWVSDEAGPELHSGNTFSGIANDCDVSRWRNETGLACPNRTDTAPLCL